MVKATLTLSRSLALRINLPRHLAHAGVEDEEGGVMKSFLSTDQLEVDFDTASDVSSEVSFGYDFAQTEVMMKGMGNNGDIFTL